MEQALLIFGASIFGLLGVLHLQYTFFTDKFSARDASVTEAMKSTSPKLTKDTTVWNAWVGFNASHSLGAIFFAAIYIPLSFGNMELINRSPWFSCLPVAVGFSYLALAKAYWFKIPLVGILLATLCFTGAAVLINT
ncbi:MAG: hypothetical protein WBN40_12545 [Pseudomonadales bacterium]